MDTGVRFAGHGLVGPKQELNLMQETTMTRVPQPVVADLMEAHGQHVLKKTANELLGRKGHRFPTGVPGVLVAEGDLAAFDGKDAVVGDGDAVHIGARYVRTRLVP